MEGREQQGMGGREGRKKLARSKTSGRKARLYQSNVAPTKII
jgi:hypothetical protein